MKTLLFISAEETHRFLYERGLRKHFAVVSAQSTKEAPAKIDAVVYDLPKEQSSADFGWLKSVDVPVVVLTPDESLSTPESSKRSVLTYPVRMNQIIEALAKLGLCMGDKC